MSGLFHEDVERAIRASFQAHDGQLRKGIGRAPYVTHPYHVALVLARHGASTRVLVGALLHDAVEDSDDWTSERVEAEFGADVRALVDELTEDKDLSWAERKAAWIHAVAGMSDDAIQVKCSDKLHNLHSLAADLEVCGNAADVWSKFHGGRERTIAHTAKIVSALGLRAPDGLRQALKEAFERFSLAAR